MHPEELEPAPASDGHLRTGVTAQPMGQESSTRTPSPSQVASFIACQSQWH